MTPLTPSETIRRIVRYLLLGLLVIVTAFVVAFALQQGQVDKIQGLAAQNRDLIEQVDQLNRRQADQAYSECEARNKRARQAITDLSRLVEAHRRDGTPNARRVWEDYLEGLRKVPLPPCERPKPQ